MMILFLQADWSNRALIILTMFKGTVRRLKGMRGTPLKKQLENGFIPILHDFPRIPYRWQRFVLKRLVFSRIGVQHGQAPRRKAIHFMKTQG